MKELIETQTEENQPKKKISDFRKHSENPFVGRVVRKTRNKGVAISKNPIDVGSAEGETTFLYMRKKVESEQFTKIFNNHMKMLFDLSQSALKVFGYICSCLEMNKDKVVFDIGECMKYTGYSSEKTIISAKAELLEKEFIAKTSVTNVFYINIALVFNGDRLVIIEDYYKGNENDSIQKNEPKSIKLKSKADTNEQENLFKDDFPFV